MLRRRVRAFPVAIGIALATASAGRAAEPAPYATYCAGCHQSNGRGGPTAPRLAGRATAIAKTVRGRPYLADVLLNGLSGPIRADGRAFDAVMPAYGHLSDAEVAGVLNELLRLAGPPTPRAFTSAEIAAQRRLGRRTPEAMAATRSRLPTTPGF